MTHGWQRRIMLREANGAFNVRTITLLTRYESYPKFLRQRGGDSFPEIMWMRIQNYYSNVIKRSIKFYAAPHPWNLHPLDVLHVLGAPALHCWLKTGIRAMEGEKGWWLHSPFLYWLIFSAIKKPPEGGLKEENIWLVYIVRLQEHRLLKRNKEVLIGFRICDWGDVVLCVSPHNHGFARSSRANRYRHTQCIPT